MVALIGSRETPPVPTTSVLTITRNRNFATGHIVEPNLSVSIDLRLPQHYIKIYQICHKLRDIQPRQELSVTVHSAHPDHNTAERFFTDTNRNTSSHTSSIYLYISLCFLTIHSNQILRFRSFRIFIITI